MAWHEKYDFGEDPFAPDERVYGLDKALDELVYRVESGSMAFVEGKEGTGKSAVLKQLIKRFGGKGKVIYFDCGQIERKVNIEKLMTGKYGLFGRIFGIKPGDMVLLLDNANFLSKKNCERIKNYFDNNYIRSVVFTGLSYSKAHFSKSLRDRIGGRIARLKQLSPEQAVQLVNGRAPGIELLSSETIKKIYKLSGNNPKKLLENLGLACEKAVSEGADKVEEKHIKEVFGDEHGK
ncbi:ATP-binding protein [Candidatus Woesearchaeota archaeon]|nr:ATP-binding protein [Candidatus Woesearchaeota archaeon]